MESCSRCSPQSSICNVVSACNCKIAPGITNNLMFSLRLSSSSIVNAHTASGNCSKLLERSNSWRRGLSCPNSAPSVSTRLKSKLQYDRRSRSENHACMKLAIVNVQPDKYATLILTNWSSFDKLGGKGHGILYILCLLTGMCLMSLWSSHNMLRLWSVAKQSGTSLSL